MDLLAVLQAQLAAEGGDDGLKPTQVQHLPWLHCLEQNAANVGKSLPHPEGKWMLFYKRALLDAAWERAKQKYRAGELPGVQQMKVSTNYPNPNSPDPSSGVLIFYCGSEADKPATKDIGRTILQAMAYTGGGRTLKSKVISWKSDAQTMAGMYANRGRAANCMTLSYAKIQPDTAAAAPPPAPAAAAAAAPAASSKRPAGNSYRLGGGGGGDGSSTGAAAAAAAAAAERAPQEGAAAKRAKLAAAAEARAKAQG